MRREISFDSACSLVERFVEHPVRREILAQVTTSKDLGQALGWLRDRMRSHVWRAGTEELNLAPMIGAYDSRTRDEGFHALHDWDGKADTVNENIIPIDVLDYVARERAAEKAGDRVGRNALAILLDYYLLHVLALLSLRIWDDGDPDTNLNRLDRLLQQLQGPQGSGQQFLENAETLILVATSHFELHERGYDGLLEKVRTLNRTHRVNVALGHAASMGSHLRFGFEATYARDTLVMRDDNFADYPWLCFSLLTLSREYSRLHEEAAVGPERDVVVEGLLNGLSPDARAFVGETPAVLSASRSAAERLEFAERFQTHRRDLVAEFGRYRPVEQIYSPIAFFFNFSHNIVKGTVVDALLRGQPWDLTLNDLLTGISRDRRGQGEGQERSAESKLALAKTLMGYARASPDRIRGRLMPVIVYDPQSGQHAYTVTLRKINQ